MWLLPSCWTWLIDKQWPTGNMVILHCYGNTSVPFWQGHFQCSCYATLYKVTRNVFNIIQSLVNANLWITWNTHSLCLASHFLRLSVSCKQLQMGCPALERKLESLIPSPDCPVLLYLTLTCGGSVLWGTVYISKTSVSGLHFLSFYKVQWYI